MSSKYERSTGWSTRDPAATSAHRAIYDGGERIDSVQDWHLTYIARGKRGQQLGTFSTMDDAIGAISAAPVESEERAS